MNQAKVLSALLLAVGSASNFGQHVFTDDFESGNLNNWTVTSPTAPNPLTIDNTQNFSPSGGTFSAKIDISGDRMHRNIIADNGGSELGGYSIFQISMFDDGVATGSSGS